MDLFKMKCSFQPTGHLFGLGVVALTLALSSNTLAGEPFEVMMHEKQVDGAQHIEAGEYAEGVERLIARLGSRKQPISVRAPILVDLCAGYTMLEAFETATRYCDEAIELGWYSGIAYNNRGALNIAKGDYASAVRDFQAAVDSKGADALARRNLLRAQQRVADTRGVQSTTVALVSDADQ
jgi:Flp pilus assembly protein TadD